MIRTAVIGFGLSAKVFHLPFIQQNAEFALEAISTSQTAAAGAAWPDTKVYADAEQLLADCDCDLVVITSPNTTHAALARQALLRGCHVLVEKPLAVSAAQARQLQQLATQTGRILAVFHNRRFDDDFLALQRLVDEGSLGTAKLLISRYDRSRPQVQQRWKESAEPGNGILYDLGPHLVDQALALFGSPQAISARCLTLRPDSPAVDYFQITLHYQQQDGRPALEVQLGSSPYQALQPLRFELHGSLGSFRCDGFDPQEALLRAQVPIHSAAWQQRRRQREAELSWHHEAGSQQLALPDGDYAAFYTHLAGTILRQHPLVVPLSDAILGLELIELALQSSREQRTLAVPQPA